MLPILFLCLSAVFAAEISFDCSCLDLGQSPQFYVSWRNFDQLGAYWVDPIIALHYVPTSYIGTPSLQYLSSRTAASMRISAWTGSQSVSITSHFSSWPFVDGQANTLYCSLTTLSSGARIQRGPLAPAGPTCSLKPTTPVPQPASYYSPTSYPTSAPTYAPSSYYPNSPPTTAPYYPSSPPTSYYPSAPKTPPTAPYSYYPNSPPTYAPSSYYPSPTSYPTSAPTYAPSSYYPSPTSYPTSAPSSYYPSSPSYYPSSAPSSYYPPPVYVPTSYPSYDVPPVSVGVIMGPIVAVIAIFLAIALVVVWFRKRAAAQELANGGFDGTSTSTTVQFDPTDGAPVQVFPQHPMMQTSFSMQDPLSTLAPVYTATYVTPGVQ